MVIDRHRILFSHIGHGLFKLPAEGSHISKHMEYHFTAACVIILCVHQTAIIKAQMKQYDANTAMISSFISSPTGLVEWTPPTFNSVINPYVCGLSMTQWDAHSIALKYAGGAKQCLFVGPDDSKSSTAMPPCHDFASREPQPYIKGLSIYGRLTHRPLPSLSHSNASNVRCSTCYAPRMPPTPLHGNPTCVNSPAPAPTSSTYSHTHRNPSSLPTTSRSRCLHVHVNRHIPITLGIIRINLCVSVAHNQRVMLRIT